mmetsp:Transcript_28973/g.48704  ORF Transcript_28973/g.48704 Transcript_28973/m.48704 type:complete len:338 (+) Transcript_28973:127-1140(+)|eukprot:CAMPEP_0184645790 /NCGR_PEP_ID=MMETSP0308-20130426/2384_1 /TAXON_ID=38269 /ORGANISM="Gloeochaete witrockiana, Strain SAG 46.84" /LENGTH=337 /DNA_ID=CAMNT_0027075203 /DNA_START=92 /DNA_END=1105 /DNA_ORIENTATION=-
MTVPEFNDTSEDLERFTALGVGVGAVGGYFCAALALAANFSVSVCMRSNGSNVRSNGIKIVQTFSDREWIFRPDQIVSKAQEYVGNPDYVLIGLKWSANFDWKGLLAPVVKPNTVLVLICNGIDVEDDLHRAFPDNELISCVAYICAERAENSDIPTVVAHYFPGRLVMGQFSVPVHRRTSARINSLCTALKHSGVSDAEISTDLSSMRFQKLMGNLIINPFSVLAGQRTSAQLFESPHLKPLIAKVVEELYTVASAHGVKFESSKAMFDRLAAHTAKFPDFQSSMLQDFKARRPLEIDGIVGNLLTLAERYAIPIPHTFTICCLLREVDHINTMTT